MRLSDSQKGNLYRAMLDLRDQPALERMIREELGSAALPSLAEPPGERARWIIKNADERGMGGVLINGLKGLLLAKRQSLSHTIDDQNPPLRAGAWDPGKRPLEEVVAMSRSTLTLAQWIERRAEREACVCLVRVGHVPSTGFLVAPDVVLTNYHVVSGLFERDPIDDLFMDPRNLSFLFDFRALPSGVNAAPRQCSLARDWLVAFCSDRPVRPEDSAFPTVSAAARGPLLDYAILRLDSAPGDDDLGGGRRRGQLTIPSRPATLAAGDPLYIVHHPNGDPLSTSIEEKNGVLSVTDDGAYVQYRTNTAHGSSGSPCFDRDWNLVALHHSGSPPEILQRYNEGVVIERIREHVPARVRPELGWG